MDLSITREHLHHQAGLNDTAAQALADFDALSNRVTELEAKLAGTPLDIVERHVVEERERIIAYLGTAFLSYTAHDPEKGLVMIGTHNIHEALKG